MTKFWNDIWGNEKDFNEAEWIRRVEERMNEVEEQEWEVINIEELRSALTKSHKWKSPGVDKIPNFWLNCLSSTHKQIALNFMNILQNPKTAAEWLTEGTAYLLPKSQKTPKPKNYRPITCLTTTHKI